MFLNEFSYEIIDKVDSRVYESVAYHPKFPIEGYSNYTIRIEEQYRADKIAYKFFQDASLSWVLDVANNFKHGFKEYTEGRVIKIPTNEVLRLMKII